MSVARFPFWRVVPGDEAGEYILPVMPPATTGPEGAPHVMGGVALGAAIDALQLDSEMPVAMAQVQFLGATHHAQELRITCEQCGGGQSIAQYGGTISANGRPTHRISAILGERAPAAQTSFLTRPDVPSPDDSTPFAIEGRAAGGLVDQVECRIAWQDEARGALALWTRSRGEFAVDASWLGIVSDFFLATHPGAHGGSSLDATIRYITDAPPGWVLSVTEFAAYTRGTVHGSARHFAENGTLLAISSQTGALPRLG